MAARKTTVKPARSSTRYTNPALRERIKTRITKGTKGGKAGQWSARKAQLVTQEYKKAGGGYVGGRGAAQQHLSKWTSEEWTTSDGKRARRRGGTTRYLPKTAWSELSPSEKRATNRKKRAASRSGRQFVANTKRARTAGAKARASPRKKATSR